MFFFFTLNNGANTSKLALCTAALHPELQPAPLFPVFH